MKRKFAISALAAGLSLLIIVSLHVTASSKHQPANDFIRRQTQGTAKLITALNLPHQRSKIVGFTDHIIYIASDANPFSLLSVNKRTNELTEVTIQSAIGTKVTVGRLRVDSPWVYLFDPYSHALFVTDLGTLRFGESKFKDQVCDFIIPMDTTRFVIRAFVPEKVAYVLAKKDHNTGIQQIPGLLKMQATGFFSLDGMLEYNKEYSRIIYLYRYRNQFLCLDSNLSLLYEGRTIDTNRTAKIKVATLHADNLMTMAEPPQVINKNTCTYGRFLFIESSLKADNETYRQFNRSVVLDVYDILTNRYVTTLYMERYRGEKIVDIRVHKETLYLVTDKYLLIYRLPSNLDTN